MIIRYHGAGRDLHGPIPAAAIINSWAQMEEGKRRRSIRRNSPARPSSSATSAPGLLDLRPTPLQRRLPGHRDPGRGPGQPPEPATSSASRPAPSIGPLILRLVC